MSCCSLSFLDESLGHAEEIKRIENRVDFLEKAYLRCKSFFETLLQARSGGRREEELEATASSSHYARDDDEMEGYNGNAEKPKIGRVDEEEDIRSANEHLKRVAREIGQIHTHLKTGIQTGSFQWIDSILIKVLLLLFIVLHIFCCCSVEVASEEKRRKLN